MRRSTLPDHTMSALPRLQFQWQPVFVEFQSAARPAPLRSGATNHITQELLPTLSSFAASTLAYSPYPLAGEGYAIAWNETVTDAYGTHDQVEFATFRSADNYLKQTVFPIGDDTEQNVRVGTFRYNGQSYVVLVYGDNTTTNIVEFDSSGNEVAYFSDPTTQTFGQLSILGDGRIAIG